MSAYEMVTFIACFLSLGYWSHLKLILLYDLYRTTSALIYTPELSKIGLPILRVFSHAQICWDLRFVSY